MASQTRSRGEESSMPPGIHTLAVLLVFVSAVGLLAVWGTVGGYVMYHTYDALTTRTHVWFFIGSVVTVVWLVVSGFIGFFVLDEGEELFDGG